MESGVEGLLVCSGWFAGRCFDSWPFGGFSFLRRGLGGYGDPGLRVSSTLAMQAWVIIVWLVGWKQSFPFICCLLSVSVDLTVLRKPNLQILEG